MRREHLCARVRVRVRGRGSVLVRDHSYALHLGQAHLESMRVRSGVGGAVYGPCSEYAATCLSIDHVCASCV